MNKQILLDEINNYINTTEEFLEQSASKTACDIIDIIGGMED